MSAKGGITKGKSHYKGGIPMVVKSTNQKVELEGGEGVINKKNMADTQLHDFEGQKLTKCEIASEINSDGGNGVEIDCDNIIGKKYKYAEGGSISATQLQQGDEWDVSNQEHKSLPNRSIRYNANNSRYELYDYINKVTDYSYTSLDDLIRNVNNIFGESFSVSMAVGGDVSFTNTNNYAERRSKGGVKIWENYKNIHDTNSVGAFSHIVNKRYVGDYYLFLLDDYDRDFYSHLPLNGHEMLFRTETSVGRISKSLPLVKINIVNGRVYFISEDNDFLSDVDDKTPKFNKASANVNFLTLDDRIRKYNQGLITYSQLLKEVN